MILAAEASQHFCPYRTSSIHTTEFAPCLGVRCMAWLWDVSFVYDPKTEREDRIMSTTHGSCGRF